MYVGGRDGSLRSFSDWMLSLTKNHLVETASMSTGSLLIWDTGEYEMLPYHEVTEQVTDDELLGDSDGESGRLSILSDSEKLHEAFQKVRCTVLYAHLSRMLSLVQRKIRIRLHGTRLPPGYTLSIRLLVSENRYEQPPKPSRKRRRRPLTGKRPVQATPPISDLDDDEQVLDPHPETMDASISALEREIAEQEDEEVRLTNSYPGATNNIGSIHQRRWYLSMDRYASGFCPLRVENRSQGGRRTWTRRREGDRLLGFAPFFVMGREAERSVVTGRTAAEVMADEGIEGFGGRKGWRPVTE